MKLYKKVQNDKTLEASSLTFKTYTGERIKAEGQIELNCGYKDRNYMLVFHVVDLDTPALLGQVDCETMGFVKRLRIMRKDDVDKTATDDVGKPYLNKNDDVYQGIGCLDSTYHIEIDRSVPPVVHPPRKVPVAMREKVQKELCRMEKLGIIEVVEEPTDWVNSMVTVAKPDGSLRICLDPRDLNKAIRREHYQLPTIDEITSKLAGAEYFSVLDASSGFWQVCLDAESSKLCTFNTPFGRYKFLRLPFGINSAPEVFHRTV
jgi:hypothetical protein